MPGAIEYILYDSDLLVDIDVLLCFVLGDLTAFQVHKCQLKTINKNYVFFARTTRQRRPNDGMLPVPTAGIMLLIGQRPPAVREYKGCC